jgi:hypothetical protein
VSSQSGSSGRVTNLDTLREQVQRQLRKELGGQPTQSREFQQFKQDLVPASHSIYEKACRWCGNLVQLNAGSKETELKGYLEEAHLDVGPGDALALALLAPFGVFFIAIILTVLLPFLITGDFLLYYLFFSMILALMAYVPLAAMPKFLAKRWRQEASNQMVLCIFYMVTYMRHTPNLELAIEFAADHIGPPLSLDLKKVLWDVETEKFQSVTDSLEHYLARWREDAREFVESVHLVQASLFEGSPERRLSSLDKALEVMLDETYEKMLHYAQNLKSPMTMLHMLGIILPVLGLVILPLVVSFFDVHWTVIATLYNVMLPLGVFYLGKRILSSRPTGYGQADTSQAQMRYHGRKRFGPALEAGVIAAALLFIGLLPILLHLVAPNFDIVIGPYELQGYIAHDGGVAGPYGLGAGLLSLFITLGAGLSLGYFYYRRSRTLIAVRWRTRRLEDEFASALFQLGNRIGDGIPIEIAFGKVALAMEGTAAGGFYSLVASNITKLGMGVEEALFDPKHGAIRQYPSSLIESSMKVLLESARKGPKEASKALMSMSNYIKEMHRVDERLKDLLADVLSSMKSQVSFLLPVIAGIVIGITSMITAVLRAINEQAAEFAGEGAADIAIADMFGLGIPTYYFQIVVGLYVVQLAYVLAYMISGVENGVDPLTEQWVKAKSLLLATGLYVGIAFGMILSFNLIAGQIMSTLV